MQPLWLPSVQCRPPLALRPQAIYSISMENVCSVFIRNRRKYLLRSTNEKQFKVPRVQPCGLFGIKNFFLIHIFPVK
ncbi:hypothetical protein BS78_03G053600 [Paspalum vaginatum]|nr:hypothetical protein BS78_03G053600 [Paspalum vaginatum]